MTRRRVRFAETARRQVRTAKTWWLANRDHPEIFAEDVEEALTVIAVLPGAGSDYSQGDVPGLRRVYLQRVGSHIYYTFDDEEVVIRAFWHARRRRGPKFTR